MTARTLLAGAWWTARVWALVPGAWARHHWQAMADAQHADALQRAQRGEDIGI